MFSRFFEFSSIFWFSLQQLFCKGPCTIGLSFSCRDQIDPWNRTCWWVALWTCYEKQKHHNIFTISINHCLSSATWCDKDDQVAWVWRICRGVWILAAVHKSDRKWRSNQVNNIHFWPKVAALFCTSYKFPSSFLSFFFGQTTTAQRWDTM